MSSKNGKISRDANGNPIQIGLFPARAQKITPGVATSVIIGATLGDLVVAVQLTCDTTMFVQLGQVNVAATVAGSAKLLPNTPYTFATKDCQYIAAIGGGGTLNVTELE